MPYRLGSVPFLNARPLVWALERKLCDWEGSIDYHWPSGLPALLESGERDAVLVSSIDALSHSDRVIAAGCSISSFGPVLSVRLLSKVPFDRIDTLALDASSMTSNALAQIILKQMFGNSPQVLTQPPDGESMLQGSDACVLIGDLGLLFDAAGLYDLDLGQAWKDLTGLPFVWACWVGKTGLTEDLADILVRAREIGERHLSPIAAECDDVVPQPLATKYLTTVFDYSFGSRQIQALEAFRSALVEDSIVTETFSPRIVGAKTEPALV